MDSFDYDLVVIGAGQGGLPAAHMAANLDARVALIEAREVGGT
ncbi:MAG: FAD-dependent oxidoreductase [Gemmatimonadales bacterium]